MGDRTAIGWTDATWNPVTGCSHVSEGCRNCYAEALSLRQGWTRKPWTAPNAVENVKLHSDRLDQPLRWRRPRKVFVNSMSDLFHEQVPDGFIEQVFIVMANAPQHTYQVLTKRPRRMLNFLAGYENGQRPNWLEAMDNIWLGVSIEDQRTADERIPLLLQTPAAVRWISAEPLLGPVDLAKIRYMHPDPPPGPPDPPMSVNALTGLVSHHVSGRAFPHRMQETEQIDWVVAGGESGPQARPMHPEWVRSLRDQCQAAGVAFNFKQWGEWLPVDQASDEQTHAARRVSGRMAGHGSEKPGVFLHLGKKAAGRLLDGRTWDEYPASVESDTP